MKSLWHVNIVINYQELGKKKFNSTVWHNCHRSELYRCFCGGKEFILQTELWIWRKY